MDNEKMRLVEDSLGSVMVPQECYYGAQTERSRINFEICTKSDKMPLEIIYSLAIIKQAAAIFNVRHGRISVNISSAIQNACCEILDAKMDDQFPLVIWQTGSGTQTNMNVNEVIAHRASEILDGKRTSKLAIHPNDHVNLGQSSNDIFPTAMNICIAVKTSWYVVPSLEHLLHTLRQKMEEFMKVVKIGRTHMQDAVPMTVGQELSGYVSQIQLSIDAIKSQIPLVCQLAIGGTAVGTGLNSIKGFSEEVCREITKLIEIRAQLMDAKHPSCLPLTFIPASNKFAVLAGHDALLQLSACLNTTATALMRLANDFCLLSSGPSCGLGEFILPANEPGSSIMPGKVNPTQCESLRMVCLQVIGNHFTTTMASSQGQLELNVYKPLIAANLLHSCQLISDSAKSFANNCVKDLQLNYSRINQYVQQSLMLVTALTPKIGYDLAAKVAKHAGETGQTLRQAAIELNVLDGQTFDLYVNPERMAFPLDETY